MLWLFTPSLKDADVVLDGVGEVAILPSVNLHTQAASRHIRAQIFIDSTQGKKAEILHHKSNAIGTCRVLIAQVQFSPDGKFLVEVHLIIEPNGTHLLEYIFCDGITAIAQPHCVTYKRAHVLGCGSRPKKNS